MEQRMFLGRAKACAKIGDLPTASQYNMRALQSGPFADARSLWHAAKALEDQSYSAAERDYGRQARQALGQLIGNGGDGSAGPKGVMFILDYSGSMSGSRIKTCVGSIQTILKDHIGDDDLVALTLFSHEVQPRMSWTQNSPQVPPPPSVVGRAWSCDLSYRGWT